MSQHFLFKKQNDREFIIKYVIPILWLVVVHQPFTGPLYSYNCGNMIYCQWFPLLRFPNDFRNHVLHLPPQNWASSLTPQLLQLLHLHHMGLEIRYDTFVKVYNLESNYLISGEGFRGLNKLCIPCLAMKTHLACCLRAIIQGNIMLRYTYKRYYKR